MMRVNLLILLSALFVAASACGCKTPSSVNETREEAKPVINTINRAQLDGMRSAPDVMLIDVREPEELKEIAPVPGAVNIPLGQLGGKIPELDKGKRIVAICRSGHRSMQAAQLLQKNGFAKVFSLEGGMLGYNKK